MDLDLSMAAAFDHGVDRDIPWDDPDSSRREETELDYHVVSQGLPLEWEAQCGDSAGWERRGCWFLVEAQAEGAKQVDFERSRHLHSAGSEEDHSKHWEYMVHAMRREKQKLECPADEAGFALVACSLFGLGPDVGKYLVSCDGWDLLTEREASGKMVWAPRDEAALLIDVVEDRMVDARRSGSCVGHDDKGTSGPSPSGR